METTEIIKALRRNMVETGNLICLGCGWEHNCSIQGCTIMREAANALESLLAEKQFTYANLKTIDDSLSELLRRAAPENKLIAIEQDTPVTLIPEKPETAPLTLEQLKNMHGEVVWVKDLVTNEIHCLQFDDFKPATYHKGDDVRFNQFGTVTGIVWWVCKYGKTWLPYACQPGGSKP